MARRLGLLSIALAAAALIDGCGSGGRTVSVAGKLVKGGAKYEVPQDQKVQMTFVAMEIEDPEGKMVPNSDPYPAEYQAESATFKVPGQDGYGIPPGKYRVAISQTLTSEAAAKQKGRNRVNRDADMLRDKFSETNSPIIREIKDAADLTIDLNSPAG